MDRPLGIADKPAVYVRESSSLWWAILGLVIVIFCFTGANLGMIINATVQLDKIEDCLDCKVDPLCGTGLDCRSNKRYSGACPRWQLPDGTTCTTDICHVSAVNKTDQPTTGTCANGVCTGGVCLGSCTQVADCPSGATLGVVDSTGSSILNSTATVCDKHVCIYQVYNNVTGIITGASSATLTGDAATEFCLNFAFNSPYYTCLKASAGQTSNNSQQITCSLMFACARSIF